MSDLRSGALPPVTVCDIDGVLSDTGHRLHHVARAPRDWEAFFAEAGRDPLIGEGRQFVVQAASAGDVIVYLTGRPERLRQATQEWLDSHGLPRGDLMMRGDADRRPAQVVKLQALRALERHYRVRAFVDDDPEVVSAAVAAGFDRAVVPPWALRGV